MVFSLTRYFVHSLPPGFTTRCLEHVWIISILCLVWLNWVVQETKDYKGIETASGQHLYSGKLIAGPSFCLRSASSTSFEDRDNGEETAHHSFSEPTSTTTDSANKVARCICITDQSLQPGVSTLLVIFPPRCMKFVLKPQPLLSFSFHFLHIFCFVFTTTIWFLMCWGLVMCRSSY